MVSISELLNINIPVVLASKSPRRKHLLGSLGLEFDVITADIDEDIDSSISPEEYCKILALGKARKVASELDYEALVIGSDTIVVLDGEIINKPETPQQAFDFLKKLSGNIHKVYTGIALINSKNQNYITDYRETTVTFRILDDNEISAYVKSGSPMDKAGAYGIQDDFGAVFVSRIEGCYYNIVGLPLELLYTSIKKFING